MIIAALLLAASPVPQSLLDAADAANLAHTHCLFETMREAHAANLSADGFESRLRSRCSAQARQVEAVSMKIARLRGEPNPQAVAERLVADSYRMAVDEYRRLPEREQQLRELQAICKANPQSCN